VPGHFRVKFNSFKTFQHAMPKYFREIGPSGLGSDGSRPLQLFTAKGDGQSEIVIDRNNLKIGDLTKSGRQIQEIINAEPLREAA